jgi:hypothetical protein
MNDSAPPAVSPPAVSNIRNVGTLLSLGWFSPAPVQRSFEWDWLYYLMTDDRLLNDIDKVLARLYPEAEAQSAGEDEAGEEETEAAAGDGAGISAPLDDFAFDEAAGELALARVAVAEEPPRHYFIGNLILSTTSPQNYEVYDGLQRLPTLTVLIAVLRDLIDDAPTRAALHHLIFDEEKYRLTLFGRDRTLAEHVQTPGATGLKSDSRAYYEIGRRILRVKNALRARIAQWDEARRVRYARFLLSSVWTSVLDVRDVRVARQMFVSTNLYGKPLETIDLLKGQIADMVSQTDSSEAVDRFSRDWEDVKQIAGDAFGEMLKAVDAIERTDTQDNTWPTELGGHLAKAYPGAQIGRFVKRLSAYAYGWKDCKRILAQAGPSRIERDFWRLHVFWWPEWHGLALRWWNQVHLARKNGQTGGPKWRALESRFNRLHRRCMGISLVQFDEADRQTIFMRAMQQDKAGRDVFQGALAFNDSQRRKIDRTLRTQIRAEEIWAPLIRWIEIAEWREGLPDLIRATNTEHVRPRRPDHDDDKVENVRKYDEGCFSLGNLAVITKEGNEKALNRDFAQKLDTLREEARWFRTMQSVVYDSKGAERTQWTNAEINSRAEMLLHHVWKLLGLKPPG